MREAVIKITESVLSGAFLVNKSFLKSDKCMWRGGFINTKKIYTWAFLTCFILLEIFVIVIGTTFALKITGLDNTAILAGLIGFIGAILGGLLTLAGVYLTISANKKNKEEEDLPIKIYRVEESKNFLKKVLEEEIRMYVSREIYDHNNYFISVNSNFEIVYSEKYETFVADYMEKLRMSLTFVDAETYRMFLDTQEKMRLITINDHMNAKEELAEFEEQMIEKYYPYEKIVEYELFGFNADLDAEDLFHFEGLKGLLWEVDNYIAHLISTYYKELLTKLNTKHETLITEFKK